MSQISLPRDSNRVTVIGGVSSVDGTTVETIYVDPVTHRLLVDSTGGGSPLTITDGITPVANVTTVNFTSNATVTNGGGGQANVAIVGGTPASPTTSVQFNDGGSFGGSSNFYYQKIAGGQFAVIAPQGATDLTGGQVDVGAGQGGGTLGDGGTASMYGGSDALGIGTGGSFSGGGSRYNDSGRAGDAKMIAGSGTTGTVDGGPITILSGHAGQVGIGGPINITAQDGGSTSGAGGPISLTAGSDQDGVSGGGNINLQSGGSNNVVSGAQIELYGGNPSGGPSSSAGHIYAQGGNSQNFLPGGGFSFSGGGSNGGNGGTVNFSGGPATVSGNGGSIQFQPGPGNSGAGNGVIEFIDPISFLNVIFDTSLLAGSDKTFTFPNASGTFALFTDIPTGAALTKTDDTNVTLTLGGSPSTSLINAASITVGWTGTLSVARGGTGAATLLGAGIPKIVATNDLTGQNAAVSSVVTTTVVNDSAYHTFMVGGYITVTAISVNTITLQVTYTDETSTSRTQSFFGEGLTTAAISTTGGFTFPPMTIRAKFNTAITVLTSIVGIGSETYDVGGFLMQIN